MMFKYLVAFLLISFAASRLIRPSELADIALAQSKLLNTHLKTESSPRDSSSSANPVQGIANATSGYLSVNDTNSNSKLFYIFYSCRGLTKKQTPSDVPTIIWLQGGPGGTSQAGNFLEFGPYILVKDASGKYKESVTKNSWNDYYNLLIIDNPRGTGYSIADKESYVTNEDQVANDFLNALLNFYALSDFKSFTKTPLFIFGESYAGHYIPSIAKRIIESNSQGQVLQIPLKGVGIGNGFVDPVHQLAENSLFAYALGLVDDVQRAKIEYYQLNGVSNILRSKWLDAQEDFDQVMDGITTYGGDLNVYNFRQFGNYDFSSLGKFFNDADTVKRYNIDPSVAGHFQDINMDVYNALSNDFMQSVAERVAFVATSGLPIMFYNGQDDIICNTPAVQNWITNLQWNGQTGLYQAPFNVWNYRNGTVAGLQKNYKNFYFVVVNKAGHLSPMDQIETTTEMVQRFVAGQTNWTKPYTVSDAKYERIEL